MIILVKLTLFELIKQLILFIYVLSKSIFTLTYVVYIYIYIYTYTSGLTGTFMPINSHFLLLEYWYKIIHNIYKICLDT